MKNPTISFPIPSQSLASSAHEICCTCHNSVSTQSTCGSCSSADKQVWMLRRAGGCTARTFVFPISKHVSKTQRVPPLKEKASANKVGHQINIFQHHRQNWVRQDSKCHRLLLTHKSHLSYSSPPSTALQVQHLKQWSLSFPNQERDATVFEITGPRINKKQ